MITKQLVDSMNGLRKFHPQYWNRQEVIHAHAFLMECRWLPSDATVNHVRKEKTLTSESRYQNPLTGVYKGPQQAIRLAVRQLKRKVPIKDQVRKLRLLIEANQHELAGVVMTEILSMVGIIVSSN